MNENVKASGEIISNFIIDHELEGIDLVNDARHIKSNKTYLLSGDGILRKAWKKIAISSELAIAIQSAL